MKQAHLCVIQPWGYVHSLGFLDQARYLRYHLGRIGVPTSIGKNRLKHGAINFVFGAHLGFDSQLTRQFACVFVNLEQLGNGGASVGQHYLRLLSGNSSIDYDAHNLRAYSGPKHAPLLEFVNAPYLHPGPELMPLEERPIDLLFVGSVNQRRMELIRAIEACGVTVAQFDGAVYGPERDSYVRQAKAVLNVHFYETARFAQARASFVLSQGTPFVSEQQRSDRAPAPYEQSTLWFGLGELRPFFADYFASERFYDDARKAHAAFTAYDPLPRVRAVWDYALECEKSRVREGGLPRWMNADMARRGYCLGQINADPVAGRIPDWMVDLRRPLPLTAELEALAGLEGMTLGELDLRLPNTATMFDNALILLEVGGLLVFEAVRPRERDDADAWIESELGPYTREFWRSQWLEYRFQVKHVGWCDKTGRPSTQERQRCRVVLQKVGCSLHERTLARAQLEDFGLVPDVYEELPNLEALDVSA